MLDLYCLGGAAVDVILEVPRLPWSGEKLFVKHSTRAAGGFIANTACAAARLGLRTAWGGIIGNDDYGQVILNDFKKFGVEINDVEIMENCSDFIVVMITPNGERTILIVPELPSPPPISTSIKRSLGQVRIAYTAPRDPGWFMEFSRSAHAGGGKIAIDMEANTIKEIKATESMLASTDFVFADEEGIVAFTGERPSCHSVEKVMALGPQLVVVTKGSEGATAFTRDNQYSVGAYHVQAEDTTGAGDCFHAAFLFGVLSGWDLQRCLNFAGAAAAISIQSIGARNGLPDVKAVQSFIDNHTNINTGE